MAKMVKLNKTYHKQAANELMIAIDPSTGKTGNLGIAIFYKGDLKESGWIEIDDPSLPDFKRMREIAYLLHEDFKEYNFDLLVVEYMPSVKVRRNLAAMPYVLQSCITTSNYGEIHSTKWQAMARYLMDWDKERHKSDEMDAVLIGLCAYLHLMGFPETAKLKTVKGQETAEELIRELGPKHNWWDIEDMKRKWK